MELWTQARPLPLIRADLYALVRVINVKISASIAARDRNRSTIAHTMSLTRFLITDQHRPILGRPPADRFAIGTGAGRSKGLKGRDPARAAVSEDGRGI